MSSPEQPGLPLQNRPNWRDISQAVHAGMHVGSRVAGFLAVVATALVLLLVPVFFGQQLGGWSCCCLGPALFAPLFVGSVGGAIPGIAAGLTRILVNRPVLAAFVGLVVASFLVVGLYALFGLWFPKAPPVAWLLPLGTALGILVGGMWAGFVDPNKVETSGSDRQVAAPFRPLRLLGWNPKRPAKTKPPRPKPGHSEGIQPTQEGTAEKPDE